MKVQLFSNFSIYSDAPKRLFNDLENRINSIEKDLPKITGQASRNVAERVKQYIGSYSSKEYYITANEVTSAIKVLRGGIGQEATLALRGRKFSLIRFNVTASKSSPLQAGVLRGSSHTISRAFVATSKSNSMQHVFRRSYAGKEFRNDLEVLRAVSIPQMAGTERALNKIEKFMRAEIDKELNPGIENILRGAS